ncbi:hypothetical protein DFJ67_4566 [Asanoa ferruginea]|uniref:CBM6 domain-containing protein n=2 Tax=Asanoa ferruginea TaxID=53367 RepID=A0A3D9ZMF3_9ACTN|nr:hypothetical protein [Asanoa ferruginea]REF98548.1 hypothetical protein DFJ67_4566 [Asanoa ferruginea]GIF53326.1 hypothetical protein Afe04nite_78650 [Asanoa ferruginea]
MSTAGDDQGELRIGGWLPPAELPAAADDGQVTQVIPAVPAQPRRPARSGPGHNPGGEAVDEPRRRGRRTAIAVAVSVATVAVAAGVPLLMSASDQPTPPDQRVLPAPTASAWPDESPTAPPTTQRPSRPPASRGTVRGAQHATPPATGTKAPDKVAAPPKTTVSLEAEAADLDGWASTRRVDSASGGRVVTRIGYRRSSLTFTTPAVPRAGDYDVVVSYVADDRRRAEVEVGGRDVGRFEFGSTGSWESVKTMTVRLPLAAGPNIIEFSNSDGWAPDLDRITLTY